MKGWLTAAYDPYALVTPQIVGRLMIAIDYGHLIWWLDSAWGISPNIAERPHSAARDGADGSPSDSGREGEI